MQVQLAGEMPSLPSQNSTLRAALVAHKGYMDRLLRLSDLLGEWIEAGQADGSLRAELPPEVLLYTLFARACDPVLGLLKAAGGQMPTADLLAEAGKHFWAEPVELHLDRMNVKREAENPDARLIRFSELHNARGQRMAMLLISMNPAELPQRKAFMANADRLMSELGLF